MYMYVYNIIKLKELINKSIIIIRSRNINIKLYLSFQKSNIFILLLWPLYIIYYESMKKKILFLKNL